ncbi:MAG: Class I peptide chain release factor [Candidatus Saccharicenans subterraneus]|uniref:Class I peptide chain release factor n=1 Tax=Candidatus Saccharicenans subterraneus TaxID=2508984 RepID=A0A3E2BP24_9BACT|nr:MAG: Class I peptide chain release factor [Candidatus Saccharicenans subterraneum]
MGMFPVRPEKEKDLLERLAKLGVKDSDLEEKFIRSQGKGGQKVNKAATCVYLKHLPTGLEVKCQRERSQALNRFLARRILVEKLEARILGKETEEQQRIEKIRRQKRKRSKKAREKMLADKKRRSLLKEMRKVFLGPEDGD